jgi:hypothetical protein
MPYIRISGLWPDYGRGPLGQVSKSKFSSFFIITMTFLTHRAKSCPILKIWDGLGSRPQAQMTMGPIQKSFLVLKSFEGALTCSILKAGTQVMLKNAYFLRRESPG